MESTLLVSLNDPSFEYDVHALVKAFYPDRNVKVLSGEREEHFFADI